MHPVHAGITAEEGDDGWDVNEIFGDEHGGAHVDLQVRSLDSPGFVQGKPCRVKGRTTSSVSRRAIVKAQQPMEEKEKLTSYRIASCGMRSMGDNPGPNTANHRDTIWPLADGK